MKLSARQRWPAKALIEGEAIANLGLDASGQRIVCSTMVQASDGMHPIEDSRL